MRLPFFAIKVGTYTNRERMAFIDCETIARLLEAAPNAEWRLMIVQPKYPKTRLAGFEPATYGLGNRRSIP